MKIGHKPARRSRRLALGAAVAASALLVAACGGGSGDDGGSNDPGLTEDSIKIGGHFPLTGVAAPGYSEIPVGHKAYYDYVNANGGIDGREIEFIAKDDGYNPAKTSEVVNELVLQDEVFAVVSGLGTPTHQAVTDFLNSEGVPDLFVSSGSTLWDQPEDLPETFGWQPDYESEGKIIGKYIAENMPDAKVGIFGQDDELGEDGARGLRQFIDGQVVAEEKYVSGNTDIGTQIGKLQAAGADVVVGFNVPSYTALSQLTAMALNYKPTWFYSNVGSDATLVGSLLEEFSEGAVKGTSPLTGVYTTSYIPTNTDTEDPWIQMFQKVWDETGDGSPLTNYKIYGMSEAYTFVQAAMAAGDDLSRESIVSVIEEEGADFEGPNLVPYRYSEDRHAGIGGMKVVQLTDDGSVEDKTPLYQTDVGDAPVEEYTGEPSTPPESGIPGE
ncbi:ABC-type branched-subunit amino acid transport system substrate-binding protein [Mumia flava]|uniref:ABC-type branched-subunit amino acid transport system substrate-binding protein n=1 Tax=Mumia flava TaxID=1348852 RepID=A0A0B2BB19_9ACTN|nr:ABC transporter substrate-binding protein [Mumia flava]PJJ53808.1 ABC-type branched-subunit amino acid transport system substrate-binding protein [Mumia flava]